MKINGVTPNKIINLYSKNSSRIENKTPEQLKDSVEISSLGRSLSSLELEPPSTNNEEKIERIRKEIKEGTYNVDAKLTAQKLIDYMKGRGL